MSSNPCDDGISRRDALRSFLVPIAGVALHRLISGCAPSAGGDEPAESTALADEAAPVPSRSDILWASGGTKSMKGGYPDPFATATGAACVLTPAMMLGPCYGPTLEREDISDGVVGVPLRLSFLVVKADGCTPVKGATVDIWHTGANGLYSTFAAGSFCNPSTADLSSERYCRGVQTSDAQGRLNFNTVVPGWYNGRAVHIHFTVRVDGKEYLTSQLFLDDALLDEIEKQTDYVAHGARNTRNDQDGILPKEGREPFMLETAKRADGALHAWKVLVLRNALDEELPSVGGEMPGNGAFPSPDGGLPPGFPGGAFPGGGFPGFPSMDGGVPPGLPPGFPGQPPGNGSR